MNRMEIPSFSLTDLLQGLGLDNLRIALINIGFIYVRDHGITPALIEQQFQASKAFFDSKLQYKEEISYNALENTGYLKIGLESLNPSLKTESEFKEAINFSKSVDKNRYPNQLPS